ncbi:MAG: sigma 54-interacting transcriptional regulator [Bacteroidota bacterium]|nr:sigma 54-interacting transcriptional regulator [Bacteroidota bacterium]
MKKIEQEQTVRDSFAALYDIAQSINSILDPEELLDKVLEIAMEHLDAERGLILLNNKESESGFDVVAAKNFTDVHSSNKLAASSSVVKKVLSSGEPVLTFDALSDERFEASRSIVSQKILSIICVPLRKMGHTERDAGGDTTGALYLDTTKTRGKFTQETLKFLAVFGHLAGIAIDNARRYDSLRKENERLKNEVGAATLHGELIGRSKTWKATLDFVMRIVDTDASVIISGESGTGKELIARAIHFSGMRKDKPFMAVNCSAIPEQLLESELFGYKKGAFTGANTDKVGLIEYANGGTLFLDEVGDLPLALQAKLLRVIQEREIRRVGDVQDRKVDVRIVSATNRDLNEEIKQGRFREDLYFRLNVISVPLAPLRERKEDIPLLARFFMEKASAAHKRQVKSLTAEAMEKLLKHPWHGNVRELQNVMERAVVLSRGEEITEADLHLQLLTEEDLVQSGLTLDEFERKLVEKTLTEMNDNRTKTAEALGVSLRWLQYRLKEWHSPKDSQGDAE